MALENLVTELSEFCFNMRSSYHGVPSTEEETKEFKSLIDELIRKTANFKHYDVEFHGFEEVIVCADNIIREPENTDRLEYFTKLIHKKFCDVDGFPAKLFGSAVNNYKMCMELYVHNKECWNKYIEECTGLIKVGDYWERIPSKNPMLSAAQKARDTDNIMVANAIEELKRLVGVKYKGEDLYRALFLSIYSDGFKFSSEILTEIRKADNYNSYDIRELTKVIRTLSRIYRQFADVVLYMDDNICKLLRSCSQLEDILNKDKVELQEAQTVSNFFWANLNASYYNIKNNVVFVEKYPKELRKVIEQLWDIVNETNLWHWYFDRVIRNHCVDYGG